jgi:hypothetical protein
MKWIEQKKFWKSRWTKNESNDVLVLLQWGSNFAEKPLHLNFEFLSSSIRFWLSTEWTNVASPNFYIEKRTLIAINLISENTKEPQDLSCPTQTHSSIQEHWVDISGRGIIPL